MLCSSGRVIKMRAKQCNLDKQEVQCSNLLGTCHKQGVIKAPGKDNVNFSHHLMLPLFRDYAEFTVHSYHWNAGGTCLVLSWHHKRMSTLVPCPVGDTQRHPRRHKCHADVGACIGWSFTKKPSSQGDKDEVEGIGQWDRQGQIC